MIKKKELQKLSMNVVIENKIFIIRGQKVMIDRDLAELYQVTTSNLNLAVKRNTRRFPEDFVFQLTKEEVQNLILQSATSSWGGSRHSPYVFTEHGVAMLSSILNSSRAIEMNIFIIRAFIKMREILSVDKNLELKLLNFQMVLKQQGKDIDDIIDRLNYLTDQPIKPLGPMGFRTK